MTGRAMSVELVQRFITETMGFPPDLFDVAPLAHLSSADFEVLLASPRNMSRGGDLPFVVHQGRVFAGNSTVLSTIIRHDHLLECGAAGLARLIGLFFVMVEVGVGGLEGELQFEQGPTTTLILAASLDGFTGRRRVYRIQVAQDGTLQWEFQP